MLYLSLFPSHKDAQQLDPRRPILTSAKVQGAEDGSARRRFGAPILIKRVSFSSSSSSSSSNRLGVRLAEQGVLLPFVERAAEVEELLNSSSGATLRTSLEAAHRHRVSASGENEWDALQHLLMRVDRDELDDRRWLQRIHALMFDNAPNLWCQLAECLGAREVTLYPEPPQLLSHDGRPEDVIVFSPSSASERFSPLTSPATQDPARLSHSVQWQQQQQPFGMPDWPSTTFETLSEVPPAFAKPSSMIECISSRADVQSPTERGAAPSSIDLSACDADEAASVLADHRHAFAGLRIGLPSSHETLTRSSSSTSSNKSGVDEASQGSRLRTKSEGGGGGLLFTKQRRLSELHALPRLRAMTQDSAATRESAVDSSLRRSSSLTSSAGKRIGSGLYRPHAAAQGDRSGLSSPWDRIERQRSTSSSSSSTSPLTVERLTPITVDESVAQPPPTPATQLADQQPALNGDKDHVDDSDDNAASHLVGLLADGRTRHPSAEPRPSSSIIFPVPPNSRFSRVQKLLSDLDADQAAQQQEGTAWHTLCEAIGVRGVEHVRSTVRRAGERSKTSDEVLLRRVAAACFGMVDMDAAVAKDTAAVQNAGGGGSDERKLRDKPWYAHHNARRSRSRSDAEHERFSEMTPMEDMDGNNQESDTDDEDDAASHEARLQAYYDDVDGYEQRWNAFRALLSRVWLVDESVIRKVHHRCGPVARLDMQTHD